VPRQKDASDIIKNGSLKEHEHCCLRILLLNVPIRSWVELRIVNHRTYHTFTEAAREKDLVLDRRHEAQTAMLLAGDVRRPPSDLRFIFVLAAESGANEQLLFIEFKNKMRDQRDNDDAILQQIEVVTQRLTSMISLSSDEVEVSNPLREYHSPSMADFSLE
jgi:hypothetical protein